MRLNNPLLEDFEPIAKRVWAVAFETGLTKLKDLGKEMEEIKEDSRLRRQFIIACHKGYAWAQNQVFGEILKLNDQATKFKAEIATLDRLSHRQRLNDLNEALEAIEDRILVLRRTCDSIAFSMFGAKHWVARRFVRHTRPQPVDINGVRNALKHARWMNQDRRTFALATDLTTFIHVGDLIQIDFRSGPAQWRLLELKDGRVNEVLLELLDAYDPSRPETRQELLNSASSISKHAPKQLNRMIKQQEDMANVLALTKETTNIGIDLSLGQKILLSRHEVRLESYLPTVREIIVRAKAKGFGVAKVDDCLYLVAVATPKAFKNVRDEAMHAMYHCIVPEAECTFLDPSGDYGRELSLIAQVKPVVDLTEGSFRSNSSPPLSMAPLKKEEFADLVFGRVCVLAHLDLFGFAALAERLGLELGFCSRKESEKTKQLIRVQWPLFNGRALYLQPQTGEWRIVIGGGMFSKILHDFLRPKEVLRIQGNPAFDFPEDPVDPPSS